VAVARVRGMSSSKPAGPGVPHQRILASGWVVLFADAGPARGGPAMAGHLPGAVRPGVHHDQVVPVEADPYGLVDQLIGHRVAHPPTDTSDERLTRRVSPKAAA
jgi:hypothetical protein